MLVAEGESKDFLGQEFLTWLWYYGETHEWTLPISEQETVSYGMDHDEEDDDPDKQKMKEVVVLEPPNEETCVQRLQGRKTIDSPEAIVALKQGKKIAMVRLHLSYQDRLWLFLCKAEHLSISSLKLVQPKAADPKQRVLELAEDLEQFTRLFEQMYAYFLSIRLAPSWDAEELPKIQTWIEEQYQEYQKRLEE